MTKKLKITRGSGNVFADIGFDNNEAENLKLRAELMMRIGDCCWQTGAPQAAMADVLDLTAPRLNALLKDKTGLSSHVGCCCSMLSSQRYPSSHPSFLLRCSGAKCSTATRLDLGTP